MDYISYCEIRKTFLTGGLIMQLEFNKEQIENVIDRIVDRTMKMPTLNRKKAAINNVSAHACSGKSFLAETVC